MRGELAALVGVGYPALAALGVLYLNLDVYHWWARSVAAIGHQDEDAALFLAHQAYLSGGDAK